MTVTKLLVTKLLKWKKKKKKKEKKNTDNIKWDDAWPSQHPYEPCDNFIENHSSIFFNWEYLFDLTKAFQAVNYTFWKKL